MPLNAAPPSHHRRERGQSLVELAISLTVMLLLLSGAVTFGMALFSYVATRDAAGEGALYGSIRPYADQPPQNGKYDAGEPVNWADICARVKAASNCPIDMSSGFTCTTGVYGAGGNNTGNAIDVSLTPAGNTNACEGTTTGGDPNGIQVTVDFDQPVMMPYMGAITGQSIHLRAQVTDTILEPRCPSP